MTLTSLGSFLGRLPSRVLASVVGIIVEFNLRAEFNGEFYLYGLHASSWGENILFNTQNHGESASLRALEAKIVFVLVQMESNAR
jgi:hypothetical protein